MTTYRNAVEGVQAVLTQPRVGIVMPAYNAARFVGDAVRSALQQDYENLCVYVVDDVSTDQTVEVVSRVARMFPNRVVWSVREENGGPAVARQAAIDMALGDGCDYIAPLDADDLRKPRSLRKQVALLEQHRDACACYGFFDIVDANGQPHVRHPWEKCAALAKRRASGPEWSRLISHGKIGDVNTLVARAAAVRECRYEPAFRYLEDVDYLAQLATLPGCSGFVECSEVVASYRFHAGQSACMSREQLPQLKFKVMQTIALRVFDRLLRQGRAVRPATRRALWRRLVVRTMLSYIRAGKYAATRQLVGPFLTPIRTLESQYRKCNSADELNKLLGVWSR